MKQSIHISLLLTCITLCASCATYQPTLENINNTSPQCTKIAAKADKLTVSLFGVNKTNAERWEFYQDFAKKGFMPLQIEFSNPTEHAFSLTHAQYALCDSTYTRIRRSQATDMALKQVEMLEAEKPFGFFGILKKMKKKKRLKEEFKKIEFNSQIIPPHTTIKGWLYFKMDKDSFAPKDFFKTFRGYQLEIAAIKNTTTNVVNNFYLSLDDFVGEFL